jgi:hypothetical protein
MNQVQIVFFERHDKWYARLTHWATGSKDDCWLYHVGWIVWLADGKAVVYDQNKRPRKIWWKPRADVIEYYFDPPAQMTMAPVTIDFLEQMHNRNKRYGYLDWLSYLQPQWLRKLFGNHPGEICSEKVDRDLWIRGYHGGWSPGMPARSPCDLYREFRRAAMPYSNEPPAWWWAK